MEINIERGEKIIISHKGSVRKFIVYVDDFDDVCYETRDNFAGKNNIFPPSKEVGIRSGGVL